MEKEYKFKINNDMHTWQNQIITGLEIRQIEPGIPDTMDLYLKMHGEPGREIKNDDEVDLSNPGIEKFYTQQSSSTAG